MFRSTINPITDPSWPVVHPKRSHWFTNLKVHLLATGLAFCASLLLAQHAAAKNMLAETVSVYMPYVAIPNNPCLQNNQGQAMINLINDHPSQQRQLLSCNPLLTTVAQSRADDLIARSYVDHINPDGFGPNYLVAQAGYGLPSHYSRSHTANSIESIVAATDGQSAEDALVYLLGSSYHRPHILGETPFYSEQFEIGVGYATDPDSDYIHYWVILISQPAD